MNRVRNALAAMAAAVVLTTPVAVALAVPALADSTNANVGFGRLYYNGSIVRTVVTPAGTPGQGVDALYAVAGQLAVTSAAPGDNYHGGRWAVYVVTWNVNVKAYLLTSDEAVLAAVDRGDITIRRMPGADFVCPVAGKVSPL